MWDAIIQSRALCVIIAICGAYLLAPQIMPKRLIETTTSIITKWELRLRQILAILAAKVARLRGFLMCKTLSKHSFPVSETVMIYCDSGNLFEYVRRMWWVGLITAAVAVFLALRFLQQSFGLEFSYVDIGIVLGTLTITQVIMIGLVHWKPMLFFGSWITGFTLLATSLIAAFSDDDVMREKIERRNQEMMTHPTSKWEPILWRLLVIVTAPTVVGGIISGSVAITALWIIMMLFILTRTVVEGQSRLASWGKRIGPKALLGTLGFILLIIAGILQIIQQQL
jgi:hypothetical protein